MLMKQQKYFYIKSWPAEGVTMEPKEDFIPEFEGGLRNGACYIDSVVGTKRKGSWEHGTAPERLVGLPVWS